GSVPIETASPALRQILVIPQIPVPVLVTAVPIRIAIPPRSRHRTPGRIRAIITKIVEVRIILIARTRARPTVLHARVTGLPIVTHPIGTPHARPTILLAGATVLRPIAIPIPTRRRTHAAVLLAVAAAVGPVAHPIAAN